MPLTKRISRKRPRTQGHAPRSQLLHVSRLPTPTEESSIGLPHSASAGSDIASSSPDPLQLSASDYPTPESNDGHSTSKKTADKPRYNRVPLLKPRRPPFLPPSMRTGCIQQTKFKHKNAPAAQHGQAAWEIMNYCLDCVRPHLVQYCDGKQELVTQTCTYHQENPDNSLHTHEYKRIRGQLERAFKNHGLVSSRPFTPPILRHRESCTHCKETFTNGFDPDTLEQLHKTEEWDESLEQKDGLNNTDEIKEQMVGVATQEATPESSQESTQEATQESSQASTQEDPSQPTADLLTVAESTSG